MSPRSRCSTRGSTPPNFSVNNGTMMTEQFPQKPQPRKKDIPVPSETEANEMCVIQFYVDLQTKAYILRLPDKEREEIRMQLIDLTRILDHLSLDADFRSDMRT